MQRALVITALTLSATVAGACPGTEELFGPGVQKVIDSKVQPFAISVAAPSLEVRSARGSKLGSISRGRRFVVNKFTPSGLFRIDWRGQRVWIHGKAFRRGQRTYQRTRLKRDTHMAVINAVEATVLEKPIFSAELGTVRQGQIYTLRTIWRNWAAIQFDDRYGWVSLSAIHVMELGFVYRKGSQPDQLKGYPGSPRTVLRSGGGFAADETPLSPEAAAAQAKTDEEKIGTLKPGFADKIKKILAELKEKGWQPRVAEAIRTEAQQREKVRKGYSKTMKSYHLLGLAVDIVDRRWGWEGPAANTNHAFWKDLGAAAAKQNLIWGGNWKSFKDVAHVQARSRTAE